MFTQTRSFVFRLFSVLILFTQLVTSAGGTPAHAAGVRYDTPATDGAASVWGIQASDSPTVSSAVQTDIIGLEGSGAFGTMVKALPNGNFVVTDPSYDIPSGAANVGAVYLYNGATLTVISTLKGSTANDAVGSSGVTVLTNGNFVVKSPSWDISSGGINLGNVNVGAVTWCSAATGCNGIVSGSNSLIGFRSSDQVGNGGVTALSNGNYVVVSPNREDIPTGFGSVGAVTWGNGMSGTVGFVMPGNSLVGIMAGDRVGGGGVTALTNGNYVVHSPDWSNPTGPIVGVGAVTWGNGNGGTVGIITPSNSLIGGTASDGFVSGVTVLTNGDYVVSSRSWDDPTGPIVDVGAVTWGNGGGGTVGLITPINSLIGGMAGDGVGNDGVTALTNGNYVVHSPGWSNPTGPIVGVGAVTWGNGNGGTVGLITPSNSLIGGTEFDQVGFSVTALTNGNYVVRSSAWNNPTGSVSSVGAVTWGNGTGGTVGLVSSSNSLIGGMANNNVGYSVTALTNGNYVVQSPYWDNPTGPITDVGAITWGNGTVGTVGLVASSNSLVGGTANDNVGIGGVTGLTNGNYVVRSSSWDNPTGPIADAGAVTWGNGVGGTVGLVTPSNSLIGGTANDNVGTEAWIFSGVKALSNGNYVVQSPSWDNPTGPIVDAGAVTWGNGVGGTVGLVTPSNSLIGGTASDQVGNAGVTALNNGNYVVQSNNWDNPTESVVNARAVTFGSSIGGTVGLITSANSVLGTVANGISDFSFDAFRNRLIVGRSASNTVSLFDCPFCGTGSILFLPLVLR